MTARHHSVPGHCHFIVPQARNTYFSGREAELALLDEYLTETDYDAGSAYPIVAVHGLGGVGYAQSWLTYLGLGPTKISRVLLGKLN